MLILPFAVSWKHCASPPCSISFFLLTNLLTVILNFLIFFRSFLETDTYRNDDSVIKSYYKKLHAHSSNYILGSQHNSTNKTNILRSLNWSAFMPLHYILHFSNKLLSFWFHIRHKTGCTLWHIGKIQQHTWSTIQSCLYYKSWIVSMSQ